MHPGTTTMHPGICPRIIIISMYTQKYRYMDHNFRYLGYTSSITDYTSRYMDHDMGSDLYYAGSVAELITAKWLEKCDHLDVKTMSPCPRLQLGQYVLQSSSVV